MARTAGSTGEKTTKAIADAAIALFAERGYAAVSMRAIAERVGIQVGALYNHFKTKQDVLVRVLSDHINRVYDAQQALNLADLPPAQALETFVRFHVRFHIDLHNEVFISFMELRSLEADNLQDIIAVRQAYEYGVRDLLSRGKADGVFNIDDAHVSAMALLAMLTGVTNWYKPSGRLSSEEIEDIYVDLAAGAVGLDREANSQIRKVS